MGDWEWRDKGPVRKHSTTRSPRLSRLLHITVRTLRSKHEAYEAASYSPHDASQPRYVKWRPANDVELFFMVEV